MLNKFQSFTKILYNNIKLIITFVHIYSRKGLRSILVASLFALFTKFKDIPQLDKLLFEVHKIHSDIRPDLFTVGEKKYTDEELERIIIDEQKPIFVAEHNGKVKGYAFCIFKQDLESKSVTNIKTLYIDDLCVDENARGKKVGTSLYNYVLQFAKDAGCYNVTLNVWAGNDGAMKFYERIGFKVQKIGMETIL